VQTPPESLVRLYGTVNNLPELMAVSDLCVTKPCSLTTSECMARRLPMVLVSPGPGQEERNAEMLLENGCAVLARTPATLAYKLETLLNDPARLDRLREGCRRTGKPHAAAEIAADLVELGRAGGGQ
jgi:processive 1,2-diacylglycerol beta-glucosyltransferase